MKTNLTISFLSIILIFFGACNIVNPKEKLPTYIQIDSVQLLPTVSATHGSVSQKITDVWVYYNRQLLGAYQLPAKVPVIASGSGQLQILAGIWNNGLSGTRAKYPFYTYDYFDIDESPTKVIKHTPVFNYRTTDTPAVKYYIESFEQGNSFMKFDGDTTFSKTNNPTEVFEGDWSAKVNLHDTITTFTSITSQEYLLPAYSECYMELNYKTDGPMTVRVQMDYQGSMIYSDVIGLNSKENWTKIYIDLKGFASTYQGAKFKIILKAQLPTGMTNANYLIDNFKIIYFN